MEAVEDRLLMTGTSAVSWISGGVSHSEVFAIDFDNTVSASMDGGAFVSLGGYAKSISAGTDSAGLPEVYAIDQNNSLMVNDNGTGWAYRWGGISAIAASNSGICYALGTDSAAYVSTPWSWSALGMGNLTAISAGTDWSGNSEFYTLDKNNIVWENSGWGWSYRGGSFKSIAASTNNTVFAIGFDNALYMNRGGSGWSNLGGGLKSISGGSDVIGNPEVYGIANNNSPWSNDNGYGYVSIGGYVNELAGDAYGRVYCRCMDLDLVESSQYNRTWNMVGSIPLTNPASSAGYSPAPSSAALFNPYNNSQPSFLDMRQGAAADCWLDASLAETALRVPQDIKNMFTYAGTTVDNGYSVGLYTVRLYSTTGSQVLVKVDTMLPWGGTYYNDINNALGSTSIWTALAEKAYAEANALGYVTTGNPNQGSYAALNNGSPAWALQAITGQSSSGYAVNPTDLASAWTSGKLVVMTTGLNPASSSIVASHCYAMVAYNPASSLPDQFFNPWGSQFNGYAPGSSSIYGQFNANAAFVSQNFTWQTYGSGASNTNSIIPTIVDTTDLNSLDSAPSKKMIKPSGLSNPSIGSIRPTVGMSIVGGPLS